MLDLIQLHEGITHRLAVIGIPNYTIKPFADLIVRWTRCSGIEWTISRLKGLKVDLIRRKAGLAPLSRIRKNSSGDVKGYLGSIFRFSDRNEASFGKAVQAMMAYSIFVHPSLTDKQIVKFKDAISCDKPDGLSHFFMKDLGRSIIKHFGKREVRRGNLGDNSLITYRGSSSKFKPCLPHTIYGVADGFGSRKQNEDVLSNALYFTSPAHAALFHKFRSLYGPVLYGMDQFVEKHIDTRQGNWVYDRDFILGGEIHFLQEQGGKLRSVASPFLVHQLALRPFGKSLYELVESLPWDCTHDQSLPVPVLQNHLKGNKMVYSIDLSSATDYFPLSIQLTVLKALYGHISDIQLFEDISRSDWRSELGTLKWHRGQPLGLYPSFASFTLTHGILLWYLNGCQHKNDFFVLGDDVVILNKDLYEAYIKILDQMGCPWSREKSISSDKLCEFAGKIVTSTMVLPQYKWREMSNDNFLDICRQLGTRSRSLLNTRQRRIFDRVKHCCLPLGLNFSFPGSNLKKMQVLTEETFTPNDSVVGSLMGLSGLVRRNVYGEQNLNCPGMFVNNNDILRILETFDEKVWSVLLRLLPNSLWLSDWILLKDPTGLSGVPEAVGSSELPSRIVNPSRVTTLEKYERMLDHASALV